MGYDVCINHIFSNSCWLALNSNRHALQISLLLKVPHTLICYLIRSKVRENEQEKDCMSSMMMNIDCSLSATPHISRKSPLSSLLSNISILKFEGHSGFHISPIMAFHIQNTAQDILYRIKKTLLLTNIIKQMSFCVCFPVNLELHTIFAKKLFNNQVGCI